jgi:hypothetical protein
LLPDLLDDGPELDQPLHGPVPLDLLALALPGQQVRQVAVVAEHIGQHRNHGHCHAHR